MDSAVPRATFGSSVIYEDAVAALDWLETAFGFEKTMLITDAEGKLAHAEMSFGQGYLMVGTAWADFVASPAKTGGKNTQYIHVHLADGIDAHYERARAAGATIVREPTDEFYGDRVYMAKDPEGHVWTFAQTVRAVTRAEAEQATGFTIESSVWR